MKRKLGFVLLFILMLFLFLRILPNMFYRQEPPDIMALNLVGAPLPEDRVCDQLRQIGDLIVIEDRKQDHWDKDDEELKGFLAENVQVLAEFERWQDKGGDPLSSDEWGLHSRVPWPSFEKQPTYVFIVSLHRLFMAQAVVCIGNGNSQKAKQSIKNSLMLAEFLGRNPSMHSLMVSCNLLNDICYLTTNLAPDICLDEEMLARLPNQQQLRTRLEQASWIESVQISKLYAHPENYGEDTNFLMLNVLGPWFYHKGHTLQLAYDHFLWEQSQTKGPLGESKPAPKPVLKGIKVANFNMLGKIMFAVGAPMYESFFMRVGFCAVSLDIARENIKARLAGRTWNLQGLKEQNNPLWNKPYTINEQGFVCVMEPSDYRWADVGRRKHFVAGLAEPKSDFDATP